MVMDEEKAIQDGERLLELAGNLDIIIGNLMF